MQIRIAEVPEAEAIVDIINLAFRVERFFIDRDRTDLKTIRGMFATGTFLTAGDGAAVVGCVYVELRSDRIYQRGYIGTLAVDPSRQQSGLGSRLMKAAEDFCAAQGCHFADLRIVNLRAELPSFYRKRGYVETGTEPFHADADPKLPCHFVNMSKPLSQGNRAADGPGSDLRGGANLNP
jgi:predicted N-acetyltransferase YhbS